MEPYSSSTSRESREDSQEFRSRSTPRTTSTDTPFANLTATNTSGENNSGSFTGASSSTAFGLCPSDGRQGPTTEVPAQPSCSQFSVVAPQPNQYSRYPKSYYSGSPLAPQTSSSQANAYQAWEYPVSDQEQSSTARLQLDRRLNHIGSTTKAHYGSSGQEPLQTNMSIMAPQYFSGIETSLNRSSHTWPVFEQQQQQQQPPYAEDARYLESLNEQQLLRRPQSTSSTSPRMMSMSLPTQRESRHLQQVRRDSKTRFRRERSQSNSYNPSLSTTPEAIPRSLALDSYSNSQSTTDVAQSRMSIQSFPPSLQLPGPQQPDIYEQPYQLGITDNNFLLSYSTAPLNPSISPFSSQAMPTSSMSSPDLGTYYRQPSALSLLNSQNQSLDSPTDPVRVVLTRPKPQCWDHGCNGRAFSTFSNLLRHQREKNGVASKPTCPNCGAEFTRTTARNGHMAHEKCKKA